MIVKKKCFWMVTCATKKTQGDVMVNEQEPETKLRGVRKDILVQEETARRDDGVANQAHSGRNELT